MAICCVYGCSNKTDKPQTNEGKRISFHKFPNKDKSPELFHAWEENVNRENFIPSVYTLVCSAHFNADDYESSSNFKVQFGLFDERKKPHPVLKKDAVPTLNLEGPSSSTSSKNAVNEADYFNCSRQVIGPIAMQSVLEPIVDIVDGEMLHRTRGIGIQCQLIGEDFVDIPSIKKFREKRTLKETASLSMGLEERNGDVSAPKRSRKSKFPVKAVIPSYEVLSDGTNSRESRKEKLEEECQMNLPPFEFKHVSAFKGQFRIKTEHEHEDQSAIVERIQMKGDESEDQSEIEEQMEPEHVDVNQSTSEEQIQTNQREENPLAIEYTYVDRSLIKEEIHIKPDADCEEQFETGGKKPEFDYVDLSVIKDGKTSSGYDAGVQCEFGVETLRNCIRLMTHHEASIQCEFGVETLRNCLRPSQLSDGKKGKRARTSQSGDGKKGKRARSLKLYDGTNGDLVQPIQLPNQLSDSNKGPKPSVKKRATKVRSSTKTLD